MKNGYYKIAFQTPMGGSGTAAIELRDGRVFGSDSLLFYRGEYQLQGDQFTAQVRVDQHSYVSGMSSVLGIPQADLTLTGKFDASKDTATFSGTAPQAPGVVLRVDMALLQPT